MKVSTSSWPGERPLKAAARVVPAIPIIDARRLTKRDARHKAGMTSSSLLSFDRFNAARRIEPMMATGCPVELLRLLKAGISEASNGNADDARQRFEAAKDTDPADWTEVRFLPSARVR